MVTRTLALETSDAIYHYRIDLVRSQAIVGAHFFDEAVSSEHPISFVVSSIEHESFSSYQRLDDDALFDVCIQAFIDPVHIMKVRQNAGLGISVGKRLP